MASKTEQARVELIIDGKLANASMRDLEAAARKVKSEMRGMMPGTPEFDAAAKNFAKINSQLTDVRVQAGLTKGSFEKLMDTAKGVFVGTLGANLAEAGVTKLFTAIKNGIQVFKEFESSLKVLKSLTGLNAEGMEFMRKSALTTSTQMGVSAKEVVEAYKLIAGAKPELLNNAQALSMVTKEAITLAKASGLDLPDASKRLVDALNQFNAPAADAGKYVNILAEGARLSAAEVPDITSALLEFGTAAKSANVSIEASTAAIETLAEKGIKGSEAGTKLRNVLLVLNAPEVLDEKALKYFEKYGVSIDVLKDKSLPLAERLTELGKIQNDAGAIASVFGKENSIAGEILIQNADRVKVLTDALSKKGLNSAQEQAAENTNTLANKVTRMGVAWDNVMAKQGAIGAFLGWIVEKFTNIIIGIDNINHSIDIFFGGIASSSVKAKEAIIDLGKTDSGKYFRDYLKEFDKMGSKEFMIGIDANKKKFLDMMAKEGVAAKDAMAIFDVYIKRRTDAMISDHKNKGATIQKPEAIVNVPTTTKLDEAREKEAEKKRKAAQKKKQAEYDAEFEDEIKSIQIAEETKSRVILKEQKALKQLLKDLENNKFLEQEDSRNNELKAAQEYYAEKLALAKQNGIDERLVTEQESAALNAINQKWDAKELGDKRRAKQAELQASRQLASELAGLANMMGGVGAEATALSKTLALANIAFDTAEAISALTLNSELNPANAVTFGAAGAFQFASGIVRIMANIGSAYQVISSAPSFFEGGYTGKGGNLDSNGGFMARLHKQEYVVNAVKMQDPLTANIVDAIDKGNLRQVMNNTVVNNNNNTVTSSPKLEMLLEQLLNKGVSAEMVFDDERLSKLSSKQSKVKATDDALSL